MGIFSRVSLLALTVVSFFEPTWAQSATAVVYTDPTTGIVFDSWTVPQSETNGTWTFGAALPSDALTTDATEFIGYLVDVYTGNATLTQISSTINSTHYTLIFRCQGCLSWDQDGATGSVSTSSQFWLIGWAQANPSPGNPTCPDDIELVQHDNGQSLFPANLDDSAANPSYSSWAALATKTVTGSCGTSTNSTATATTTSSATATTTATISSSPVPTASYDYIVVGAGAGGIPIADKLSESGKSVLLIEKGPPSSGRWGGTMRPDWLDDTNLTRFDVPGLCNQIWHDSAGIACSDTDQMAGCVLGGGTAVNAGLWWKPNTVDWDYNFPTGWRSTDMAAATSRVFSRIPGTDHPSMDGQLYLQQGFNVISSGLQKAGWTSVTANDVPNQKNHTYAHTAYMSSNGERGGPMATYLVTASARSNFMLWTGTSVKRVIRQGGHITGVEVEPFLSGGYSGVVNLTSTTGRVILSAGTFGTAKLLMRSGIGPADQLAVVASSAADGPTMIGNQSWIELPVGYNLDDHVNTDTVIQHPNVTFYDFYAAYDTPNTTDADKYLTRRAGVLAQAAPNIGPMFWDEITGADGITRQLQWTSRVEGGDGVPDGTSVTMSQYLGRGATSRGRTTITSGLDMVVSTLPYLRDDNDVAAVVQGIKNLQAALASVAGLTWAYPAGNVSVEDFVDDMLVSYTNRRANHWIGSAKMGSDDGRIGGSAVVDLNARVYGTDNLFVVDASVFPGHVTTNPSSYVVTVAERASEKILALAVNTALAQYAQCGGLNWNGGFTCKTPYTCTYQNDYYWQCL
ncbi:hypothetical protein VMCG_06665 [Cytospora schulzeri]|uniref:CBM1 domain-containing protein n=1 Tax=Cytospora schulzeri TaxID=448051 RepID=A0A423W726_9PEZI|nr:hypothetical protein VMCG_06665 [Valsa malicola]